MSKDTENKYRYWMLTLFEDSKDKDVPSKLKMQRILDNLCDSYVFQLEKTPSTGRLHYQCVLKLKERKRQGTLINDLVKGFDVVELSIIQVQRMMGTWEEAVNYCTKKDTRNDANEQPFYSSGVVVPYAGADIEFLNEYYNRYDWQNRLFEILFEVIPTKLRDPNDRDIIWITDKQGNSGKSKFVKYCCFYNKSCTKISFGSAGQLRSSIIHAGAKVCYFVDMPRTLGTDDSINSIMSALEDTLNGFITSSYYGESKTLLMQPPHVVVFSNDDAPISKMSSDRWKVYHIIHKDLLSFD